ncbi:F-box DNA helicase protein 1 [Actinoplanes sp. SE50]|uniref:AAA family ATPase n=1 Tax=unclassified Actinoplanes TaxID=2626549 RepID=UPI00023EF37E|nr:MULTISPECIES: AAA family ATPase [unclassified Actinoplanes]AEV86815.1 F-box DNA helicase protein 1 [Actinoplanes sp. SE50/110]ATO85212.1 F-box DNA helicase protein 1 [Actinoplanes sp. SE50]SLM02622.1 F-box DNA helicase 1 [Actinoplanes sp. SE50/110]
MTDPAPRTVEQIQLNDYITTTDTSGDRARPIAGYVAERTGSALTLSAYPDGEGLTRTVTVQPDTVVTVGVGLAVEDVLVWKDPVTGAPVTDPSLDALAAGTVLRDRERAHRIRERIAEVNAAATVLADGVSRLALLSPVAQAELRVAVEAHGPTYRRNPMLQPGSGSIDYAAIGRYVTEGHLRDLDARYGFRLVWEAVEEYARQAQDREQILTRTPQQIATHAEQRTRQCAEHAAAAGTAMTAGDYAAAYYRIDQGQQIYPGYQHGAGRYTWNELRGKVAARELAAVQTSTPANPDQHAEPTPADTPRPTIPGLDCGGHDEPATEAPTANPAPELPAIGIPQPAATPGGEVHASQAAAEPDATSPAPVIDGSTQHAAAEADPPMPAPVATSGVLAEFDAVQQARIRVAVEDNAGRYAGTPGIGRSPGAVARYIGESAGLADIGAGDRWKRVAAAAREILERRPELMDLDTDDKRTAAARDRTGAVTRILAAIDAAYAAGDFTRTLALLERGELLDPTHRPNGNNTWERLRQFVAKRQRAASPPAVPGIGQPEPSPVAAGSAAPAAVAGHLDPAPPGTAKQAADLQGRPAQRDQAPTVDATPPQQYTAAAPTLGSAEQPSDLTTPPAKAPVSDPHQPMATTAAGSPEQLVPAVDPHNIEDTAAARRQQIQAVAVNRGPALDKLLAEIGNPRLAQPVVEDDARRYALGYPAVRKGRGDYSWACPIPDCDTVRGDLPSMRATRSMWLAHAEAAHPMYSPSWDEHSWPVTDLRQDGRTTPAPMPRIDDPAFGVDRARRSNPSALDLETGEPSIPSSFVDLSPDQIAALERAGDVLGMVYGIVVHRDAGRAMVTGPFINADAAWSWWHVPTNRAVRHHNPTVMFTLLARAEQEQHPLYLQAEADEIMATAGPGSDRRQVTWAIGVSEATYADTIVSAWAATYPGFQPNPNDGGTLRPRGTNRVRWAHLTPEGFRLTADETGKQELFTATWPEIRAHIARDRLPHTTVQRLEDAYAQQQATHTTYDDPHQHDPEHQALEEAASRENEAAAAAAWATVRPSDTTDRRRVLPPAAPARSAREVAAQPRQVAPGLAVDAPPADYPAAINRLQTVPNTEQLGRAPIDEVATSAYVQVTGLLPDGRTTTLAGYLVDVQHHYDGWAGWVPGRHALVTLADRPSALTGVEIAVAPDEQATVLSAPAGMPGGTYPWQLPSPLDRVIAALALQGRTLQPVTTTSGPGWLLPDVDHPFTGDNAAATMLRHLTSSWGQRHAVPVLRQELIDAAVAENRWTGPDPAGPTPLQLTPSGAHGTVTGLVDGEHHTVTGTLQWIKPDSPDRTGLTTTVTAQMRIDDQQAAALGIDGPSRVIAVHVPASDATFTIERRPGPVSTPQQTSGAVTNHSPDGQQDLFAMLWGGQPQQSSDERAGREPIRSTDRAALAEVPADPVRTAQRPGDLLRRARRERGGTDSELDGFAGRAGSAGGELHGQAGPDQHGTDERRGRGDAGHAAAAGDHHDLTGPAAGGQPPRFRPGGQHDLAPSGELARIRANLAALRTLRAVQAEQRPATSDEQAILARWSGWGAIPAALDDQKPQYAWVRQELAQLLDEREMAAAKRTVINAHYTDAALVQVIWDAVTDLGFAGGQVLEPGCGSGNFLAFAPDAATLTGVELDPSTAAIAAALYPHATILAESFADTRVATGGVDLTIGNVPFGAVRLHDKRDNGGNHSIHNHFILKSLRATRPGGLVAVITSAYTLDALNPAARREIQAMGDLVGAVRLPSRAHAKAAGTDALTDVLIFRRRGDHEPAAPFTWEYTRQVDVDDVTLPVNNYFVEQPQRVLGRLAAKDGLYRGDELTVTGDPAAAPDQLRDALAAIAAEAQTLGLTMSTRHEPAPAPPAAALPRSVHRPDGFLRANDDGTFSRLDDGQWESYTVPKAHAAELRALLQLRDTAVALLEAEAASLDNSADIDQLRTELDRRYHAYTGRYEAINRFTDVPALRKDKATDKMVPAVDEETGEPIMRRQRPPAVSRFRADPFAPVVLALEIFDAETQTATKADIFTQRVVARRAPRLGADTPAEALAICLDEHGEVRLDVIGWLLGVTPEQARTALGTLVFDDPAARRLELAAAYLSGDVKTKLAIAAAAADEDPIYLVNVTALTEAVPRDLSPDEITIKMDAPWIGASYIQQFLTEILDDPTVKVEYGGGVMWSVTSSRTDTVAARSTWGTERRPATEIAQNILEQRDIVIKDTIKRDGDKRQVVNLDATMEAIDKAVEIRERFADWVWEDPERAATLVARYNDLFRRYVPRDYSGTEMSLPGLATAFLPDPHQKTAVARILHEPGVGLYHSVGAGKTASMIMGAMELRRLGMARKPAIIVPNQLIDQWVREFVRLYPQAKILAAGAEELTGTTADKTADIRRRTVARMATGDWDAVILTETAFEMLPMSIEAEHAYLENELAALKERVAEAKAHGNETILKRLETKLANREERLKNRLDNAKDAGVWWELTGIDYLFRDESHRDKNLRTVSNVPGMTIPGSQRATQMDMKLAWLRDRQPRWGTRATGTPIANSIVELYTEFRYLRPDLMAALGVTDIDSFLATFAEGEAIIEVTPDGGGLRNKIRHKFVNLDELITSTRVFADVKTKDQLDLERPALAERADGQRTPEMVIVEPSAELLDKVAELVQRAADLKGRGRPEKGEDNILKIVGEGAAAALDLALVGLDTDEPQKLDVAADHIAQIYHDNADRVYGGPDGQPHPVPGALQMVFCDLGTPSGKPGKFNAYAKLRRLLADQGVPIDKVRFIHDATNDRERAELFAACRDGRVAVLIGSTEKMGTGVNVQQRLLALHHLDCPWRPCDLEQREGRIDRRGNQNPEIRILRYSVERSLDAFRWQKVAYKARLADQVLLGQAGREADDIGDTTLSYEEMKAATTGNPLLIEHAEAQRDFGRLERLQRGYHRNRSQLEWTVRSNRQTITINEQLVAEATAAISRRQPATGDQFSMTVRGRRHGKRRDANDHLKGVLGLAVNDPAYRDTDTTIGEYGGLSLTARTAEVWVKTGNSVDRGIEVVLSLADVPQSEVSLLPTDLAKADLVTRLENRLTNLDTLITKTTTDTERCHQQIERAEQELTKPFRHADAHAEARHRFHTLDAQVRALAAASDQETGVGEPESPTTVSTPEPAEAAPEPHAARPAAIPARNAPSAGPGPATPAATSAPTPDSLPATHDSDTPPDLLEILAALPVNQEQWLIRSVTRLAGDDQIRALAHANSYDRIANILHERLDEMVAAGAVDDDPSLADGMSLLTRYFDDDTLRGPFLAAAGPHLYAQGRAAAPTDPTLSDPAPSTSAGAQPGGVVGAAARLDQLLTAREITQRQRQWLISQVEALAREPRTVAAVHANDYDNFHLAVKEPIADLLSLVAGDELSDDGFDLHSKLTGRPGPLADAFISTVSEYLYEAAGSADMLTAPSTDPAPAPGLGRGQQKPASTTAKVDGEVLAQAEQYGREAYAHADTAAPAADPRTLALVADWPVGAGADQVFAAFSRGYAAAADQAAAAVLGDGGPVVEAVAGPAVSESTMSLAAPSVSTDAPASGDDEQLLRPPAARTPQVWEFTSTGVAYDAVNSSDDIVSGDILHVPHEHIVAIASAAWPVAVTAEPGAFHPADLAGLAAIGYADSIRLAQNLATAHGYALDGEPAQHAEAATSDAASTAVGAGGLEDSPQAGNPQAAEPDPDRVSAPAEPVGPNPASPAGGVLPDGAEPIDEVSGYHEHDLNGQITIYGPDHSVVATADPGARIGLVGGVRIPADRAGRYRFGVLAARQHRAQQLPRDSQDRVWIQLVPDRTAKAGYIVEVHGTVQGDAADDRAVRDRAALNWSGKKKARVTSRTWNPATVRNKLYELLTEFTRQNRNVVVRDSDPRPSTPLSEPAQNPTEQRIERDTATAAEPAMGPAAEAEPAAGTDHEPGLRPPSDGQQHTTGSGGPDRAPDAPEALPTASNIAGQPAGNQTPGQAGHELEGRAALPMPTPDTTAPPSAAAVPTAADTMPLPAGDQTLLTPAAPAADQSTATEPPPGAGPGTPVAAATPPPAGDTERDADTAAAGPDVDRSKPQPPQTAPPIPAAAGDPNLHTEATTMPEPRAAGTHAWDHITVITDDGFARVTGTTGSPAEAPLRDFLKDPANFPGRLRFTLRRDKSEWVLRGTTAQASEAARTVRRWLADPLTRLSGTTTKADLRATPAPPAPKTPKITLSEQQQAIRQAYLDGKNIAVQALAGTGKTSTLVALAEATPGKRIAYFAFNRAIADEAKAKFNPTVQAETSHYFARTGLRTHAIAPKLTRVVDGDGWPSEWATPLQIKDLILHDSEHSELVSKERIAGAVMATINAFRQSADPELSTAHLPEHLAHGNKRLRDVVFRHAVRAWVDKTSVTGTLPFCHDDYRKIWALTNPILTYDVIFFDEAQDMQPVMEKVILDRQNAGKQVVIVGDSQQSIYGFTGASDAISRWPADVVLPLTQSWRFGAAVAEVGNRLLTSLESRWQLQGNPNLNSSIGPVPYPDAVLARTNAGAVAAVFDALDQQRKVALVGGSKVIENIAKAALKLQAGRRTSHPDLAGFTTWSDVVDAVENQENGVHPLRAFVRLVESRGAQKLLDMARDLVPDTATTPDGKPAYDVIVCTAHKAKGLEWDFVRIASDFPQPELDEATGETRLPGAEDQRLAYVALTRGRTRTQLGSLDYVTSSALDRPATSHAAIAGPQQQALKPGPDLADTSTRVEPRAAEPLPPVAVAAGEPEQPDTDAASATAEPAITGNPDVTAQLVPADMPATDPVAAAAGERQPTLFETVMPPAATTSNTAAQQPPPHPAAAATPDADQAALTTADQLPQNAEETMTADIPDAEHPRATPPAAATDPDPVHPAAPDDGAPITPPVSQPEPEESPTLSGPATAPSADAPIIAAPAPDADSTAGPQPTSAGTTGPDVWQQARTILAGHEQEPEARLAWALAATAVQSGLAAGTWSMTPDATVGVTGVVNGHVNDQLRVRADTGAARLERHDGTIVYAADWQRMMRILTPQQTSRLAAVSTAAADAKQRLSGFVTRSRQKLTEQRQKLVTRWENLRDKALATAADIWAHVRNVRPAMQSTINRLARTVLAATEPPPAAARDQQKAEQAGPDPVGTAQPSTSANRSDDKAADDKAASAPSPEAAIAAPATHAEDQVDANTPAVMQPADLTHIRLVVIDTAAEYFAGSQGHGIAGTAVHLAQTALQAETARFGLAPVVQAAADVMADDRSILTRTPEQRQTARAQRTAQSEMFADLIRSLAAAGDNEAALRLIDDAARHDPRHRTTWAQEPNLSWSEVSDRVRSTRPAGTAFVPMPRAASAGRPAPAGAGQAFTAAGTRSTPAPAIRRPVPPQPASTGHRPHR